MSVIPQTPRASEGLVPPGPPTGALPWTRWGPWSPDPSPTHAPPPLTTNSGSAPDIYSTSWVVRLVTLCSGFLGDATVESVGRGYPSTLVNKEYLTSCI